MLKLCLIRGCLCLMFISKIFVWSLISIVFYSVHSLRWISCSCRDRKWCRSLGYLRRGSCTVFFSNHCYILNTGSMSILDRKYCFLVSWADGAQIQQSSEGERSLRCWRLWVRSCCNSEWSVYVLWCFFEIDESGSNRNMLNFRFDSVPCDFGTEYLKRDFEGTLAYVETYGRLNKGSVVSIFITVLLKFHRLLVVWEPISAILIIFIILDLTPSATAPIILWICRATR